MCRYTHRLGSPSPRSHVRTPRPSQHFYFFSLLHAAWCSVDYNPDPESVPARVVAAADDDDDGLLDAFRGGYTQIDLQACFPSTGC